MMRSKALCLVLFCALLTGCASKAPAAPAATASPTPAATEAPAAESTPAPTQSAATSAPTATPTSAPTPTATATPTAAPTVKPTATPTPRPTAAPVVTATPVPERPFVSKHPASATVTEGGSCTFEAGYINAIWAVWHFVSPDGKTDLTYEQIGTRFPQMQVLYGMYSKMELKNIPLAANGWKVYCRYTNNGGYTDTNPATLTVTAGTPTAAPAPGSFELAGRYMDSVSQRASMEITGTPVLYNVSIHWGSSAFQSTDWTFSGTFDTTGVMRFSNCTKVESIYDSNGNGSHTTRYTNGSGTLTYNASTGVIAWDDGHGSTGSFVRSTDVQPTPNAANEWTETTSLDTAVSVSGVRFTPPIPEALPEGVALDTYRCRSGIIEARYSGGTMVIRKSNTVSGSNLSGDYNTYSQAWDHVLKGLTVHCRGNGTTTNETTYSSGEYYYSISFRPGEEGRGLTLDQINSLVNGMM